MVASPPRKSPTPFFFSPKFQSKRRPPPVCHFCGIAGHIKPNCYRLKKVGSEKKRFNRSPVRRPSRSGPHSPMRDSAEMLCHLNELAAQSSYLVTQVDKLFLTLNVPCLLDRGIVFIRMFHLAHNLKQQQFPNLVKVNCPSDGTWYRIPTR
ncbi:hypothetical protein U1Q18_052750 [Sarracenia purpurea var. burkii]